MSKGNDTALSGFMVVRLPNYNFDSIASRQMEIVIPEFNGNLYCGIDRMAWFDFDEAYYNNMLPEDLSAIWKTKNSIDDISTSIEIVYELSDAKKVLSFCNKEDIRNEIISVSATCIKKIITNINDHEAREWIGYDLVSIGEFSLLLSGVYKNPELFEEIGNKLNKHGLFEDLETVRLYKQQYLQKTKAGFCEDVYGPIEIIRVGKN